MENLVYPNYMQLMTMVAGLAFLLPLKKKERVGLRVLACGIQVMILMLGGSLLMSWLKPESYGLTEVCGWLMQLFSLLLLFGICADMPFSGAVYCSVWALMLSRLLYAAWQLLFLYGIRLSSLQDTFYAGLESVWVFGLGYLIAGMTVARWMPRQNRYFIGPRQLISAILLMLLSEYLHRQMLDQPMIGEGKRGIEMLVMLQGYCTLILYLQGELFKKSAMRQEIQTLNLLWHQQKEQYNLAKENIAIINRKCHDMKHQIAALRHIGDAGEREKYLDEVTQSIRIYESIVKTGNEALDTILTEKSLYCEANKIQIHCIADGSQLQFMDPVDLYTIFGNALDNAIESVQQLKAADRRLIDVIVHAKQHFLTINILNPIEGKPTFEGNLPISTKGDRDNHGYGIKSIRHTVRKYNGHITIKTENGCFSLMILIPIMDTTQRLDQEQALA